MKLPHRVIAELAAIADMDPMDVNSWGSVRISFEIAERILQGEQFLAALETMKEMGISPEMAAKLFAHTGTETVQFAGSPKESA